MASDTGPASNSLSGDALGDHTVGSDFFRVVRQLERNSPGRPRVGTARRSQNDIVTFGQRPSLSFATSTISSATPGSQGGPAHIEVLVMGMLGPNGPMPRHLTDFIARRERHHGDTAPAAFLDLVNNRAIALCYRAWALSKPTVSRDRPNEDRFTAYLLSLIGFGLSSDRDRDCLPDTARIYYAGRLVAQERNPEGLAAILSDLCRVPVEIVESMGQWLDVPARERGRLGASLATGCLGTSLVLGERVWTTQFKFRVRIGPMSLEELSALLPGDQGFARLQAWIRTYHGQELDWEVQLVLRADEIPATQLGSVSRLGYTSWLKTRPMACDAYDLVVQGQAALSHEGPEHG